MDLNICIFGASVTWGAWDHERGGWVNRLRLDLEVTNDNIMVYNLGVSGDTINDILDRFEVETKARKPGLLIFSIGDNDSVFIKSKNRNNVPIKQFEKNIVKLIKKAKKLTDKVIFLGAKIFDESKTNPIPWETDFYYTNANSKLYSQTVKKLAEENGCAFIEMDDLLNLEDLDDGLHPKAVGHEKIYLKVKEYLVSNKLI